MAVFIAGGFLRSTEYPMTNNDILHEGYIVPRKISQDRTLIVDKIPGASVAGDNFKFLPIPRGFFPLPRCIRQTLIQAHAFWRKVTTGISLFSLFLFHHMTLLQYQKK